MKKIILILIALAAITASCVKYEEGPLVSSLSVKKKIYGFYFLTEYTVNGIDSLSQNGGDLYLRFDFFYNDISKRDVCVIEGTAIYNLGSLYWGWELSDNKKNIRVSDANSDTNGSGPFGNNKTPVWEIIKLLKDQIKLKTNFNNKEYQILLIAS